MPVGEVFRACVRRWYILLPLLGLTMWYAYGSYRSVSPVYYANAVVGVRASNEQLQYNPDGRPVPRNGLVDVGGPQLVMNMVVLSFNDPEVRSRVVAEGGKPNFTVRMFPNPPGAPPQNPLPLLMIEATEPDPTSAKKTVELAASQVDPVLVTIQSQAGVADSQMLRSIAASTPNAVKAMPSRTKTALVIAMFGCGFAILATVASDALITRVKRSDRRLATE